MKQAFLKLLTLAQSVSFRVKLFGAFAAVILAGVLTLYWLSHREASRQFIGYSRELERAQALGLVEIFADYYARTGSWQGLSQFFEFLGGDRMRRGQPERSELVAIWQFDLVLADRDGRIVFDPEGQFLGQQVETGLLALGLPISVGGERVGTLLTGALLGHFNPAQRQFLESLTRAILLAGLAAGAVAVVLGLLFVQQLRRPLQALATAAQRIAARDLSQRLPVQSHDELGQVAQAFNQMSNDLQRSEALRRQMIQDVAHELHTPLFLLRGRVEAFQDGLLEPSAENLEILHDELLLLARLVNDLRELALAEAGELRLEKRLFDLTELLCNLEIAVRPRLRARQIEFVLQLPKELPTVEVDPDRIKQVLLNLFSNAERYTPAGGEICLTATATLEGLQVSVADSGPGIAPEDLLYVFERFWRGDKSRSRQSGGSGLGLAIAKKLIEAHGGRIWAENSDRGATFAFILPPARP